MAREGLYRIRGFFELEAQWRGQAPAMILQLRQQRLRPLLESFFIWAAQEYAKVQNERGLLRTALGYALRQQAPLLRPLDDGRLVLDNNRSERALRPIASPVSLCTSSSSARNYDGSRITRNSRRAAGALAAPCERVADLGPIEIGGHDLPWRIDDELPGRQDALMNQSANYVA